MSGLLAFSGGGVMGRQAGFQEFGFHSRTSELGVGGAVSTVKKSRD
jgi:hypothetical protein